MKIIIYFIITNYIQYTLYILQPQKEWTPSSDL